MSFNWKLNKKKDLKDLTIELCEEVYEEEEEEEEEENSNHKPLRVACKGISTINNRIHLNDLTWSLKSVGM